MTKCSIPHVYEEFDTMPRSSRHRYSVFASKPKSNTETAISVVYFPKKTYNFFFENWKSKWNWGFGMKKNENRTDFQISKPFPCLLLNNSRTLEQGRTKWNKGGAVGVENLKGHDVDRVRSAEQRFKGFKLKERNEPAIESI